MKDLFLNGKIIGVEKIFAQFNDELETTYNLSVEEEGNEAKIVFEIPDIYRVFYAVNTYGLERMEVHLEALNLDIVVKSARTINDFLNTVQQLFQKLMYNLAEKVVE